MSGLVIRPITAKDEAEWRRLWMAYLAYYRTELPDEIYEAAFSRLLGDDAHDFHGMIAELDGRCVGLVHYLYHRNMWKIENVCYLQDLFADPDVRGTGVGRALIQAVYAAADAAGAPAVYWLTEEFNKTARHLYDRIGTLTPLIRYNRA